MNFYEQQISYPYTIILYRSQGEKLMNSTITEKDIFSRFRQYSGCRNIVGIVFILLLILPGQAIAIKDHPYPVKDLTELGLQELMEIKISTVYGASKYEQKMTDAPAAVSIITSEDIKRYGHRTLADILRSVRSFYTTYDRNYHYLGIRGFSRPGDYNTRFLLLVDGHRINDNVYDQAFIGTDFLLDIDLIDRIEVIRGPSSSIYGTNAFLGVINVMTRKGSQIGATEVSGEAASVDTYKMRMTVGKKFETGLDTLISGSGYESQGKNELYYREFDSPDTNNGITRKADGDRYHSVFSTLALKDFTLQGAYVSRDKTIPTAPWGIVFNTTVSGTRDDRGYLDLKYEHDFDERMNVALRFFYDYYQYRGSYLLTDALDKDKAIGEAWGADLKVSVKQIRKHNIILGGTFIYNIRQDQSEYDDLTGETFLDDHRSSQNWAFYIQDEFKFLDCLMLNVGVRYDYYDTFGGTTHPRAAIIYQPLEATALKFIYGTAFRAPNVYEMYYNDGGYSQKQNPHLQPETIETYELIFEKYMKHQLRMAVALFFNTIKDIISLEVDPSDGLGVFRNMGRVETKGIEMEVEKQWDGGLKGLISYSYQETENKHTNDTITNSPVHMIKGNLIVPLWKDKIFVGLEEQYTSERKLLDGTHVGDVLLTNLTLSADNMISGLKLSAGLYNAFNVTYEDPASVEHLQRAIEQDGRSFRLKLTYRF